MFESPFLEGEVMSRGLLLLGVSAAHNGYVRENADGSLDFFYSRYLCKNAPSRTSTACTIRNRGP
jgi:hypothetical protein